MIELRSCLRKRMASLIFQRVNFAVNVQKNTIYALSTGFNSAISVNLVKIR